MVKQRRLEGCFCVSSRLERSCPSSLAVDNIGDVVTKLYHVFFWFVLMFFREVVLLVNRWAELRIVLFASDFLEYVFWTK